MAVNGENSLYEETLAPLLDQNSACQNEDLESRISVIDKSGNSREQMSMVYLSTIVAVCGSLECAICLGYSSPTQSAITEELSLSTAEYSVFGSILTCGAMVGAIMSGTIADLIGRKWAMRVSGSICSAGWLAIYFAKGPAALDIGRLATGYGMGVFSYVVPVYIAEITPRNVRGALTTLNSVTMGIGLFLTYGLGSVLSWRNLALIGELLNLKRIIAGILPCVIQIMGLFLIPESPRWLVSMMKKNLSLSHPIGLGMMAFQQLGGINGIFINSNNCYFLRFFLLSVGDCLIVQAHALSTSLDSVLAVIGLLVTLDPNVRGTFILYGAINALAIIFVVTIVPETKGKSLEETQAAVNR